VEKIKITKQEIEDMYEVTDDTLEKPSEEQTDQTEKNFTFEEYTEYFDKKDMKDLAS